MLRKTKIQIIAGVVLGVFSIGAFFYFYKAGENKKVELNLAQNSDEQKQEIAQENISNQDNDADIPEKVDPLSLTSSAEELRRVEELQRGEGKDTKVVDNSLTADASGEPEAPKVTKLSITNRLVSFGFQASSERKIDTVIIHSSYDAIGDDPYSVSGVIAEYKSYGVSPHYLIDRKRNVYRLVEDKNIAYHAGESKMPDGRTGVNNFSIGVEMLTTKKDKLTDAQYSALKLLIADLKGKYKITNVLGHNQIAPGRKDDPWNFEWGKLK